MNDPNGLISVDGRQHVFFQYNPRSTRAESMCWGHMSSVDLLHWDEHAIALAPREGGIDSYGCWSGSAALIDGRPHLYYSAVSSQPGFGVVAHARTEDPELIRWVQDEQPVVGVPTLSGLLGVRDPFLFEFDGRCFALQGAGTAEGGPRLLLYRVSGARSWQLAGELSVRVDDHAARLLDSEIWECPQIVPVSGRWLLVVSIWRNRGGCRTLNGSVAVLGDLVHSESGLLEFHGQSAEPFDLGEQFYAPQLQVLPNRVLCWGWCRERDDLSIQGTGWAGLLSLPREIGRAEERITVHPASELVGLRRGGPVEAEVAGDVRLEAPGETIVTANSDVRIRLCDGTGADHVLCLSPGKSLRVFSDRTVCEAFVSSGPSLTLRIADGTTPSLSLEGDARVEHYELRAVALRPSRDVRDGGSHDHA